MVMSRLAMLGMLVGARALPLAPRARLIGTGGGPKRVDVRGGGGSPRQGVGAPALSALASWYAASLAAQPIITKSITSGLVFTAADATSQRIAPNPKGFQRKQMLLSGIVGLCFMGPAAHYWYSAMTQFFPQTTLPYILFKALCGQLAFGPVFTTIFFAASCIGNNQGFKTFSSMVRHDLLPTLRNGLCYWPFVDIISYSFVPVNYIPLFVNMASFVWTIYLALKAASAARRRPEELPGSTPVRARQA